MNPLTCEWVEKAEGDFETVELLARSHRPRTHDSLCFHAQQCAEKYLKARLQEADIAFSRTHNLTELLEKLLGVEPLLEELRAPLRVLNRYSVALRYPGDFASAQEAQEARTAIRSVRLALREVLGLERQRKLPARRCHK